MTDNQSPVDKFTLLHVLAGHLMRRAGFSWKLTLGLAASWEILEPIFKKEHPDLFPNPTADSERNKVVDVLATLLGWSLSN